MSCLYKSNGWWGSNKGHLQKNEIFWLIEIIADEDMTSFKILTKDGIKFVQVWGMVGISIIADKI